MMAYERHYKQGYLPTSVDVAPRLAFKNMSIDATISRSREDSKTYKPQVVGTTLPYFIREVARPTPASNNTESFKCAFQMRVGAAMPPLNRHMFRRFRRYALHLARREFTPIPADADLSFKTWLEEINQPGDRKIELALARKRLEEGIPNRKLMTTKGFLKEEDYDNWKHPRGINAPPDEAKVLCGPVVRAMEKVVFSTPHFVKKIPVADRCQFVTSRLQVTGNKYLETDYTSWEAGVNPHMMSVVHEVYAYLLGNHPEAPEFLNYCRTIRGWVSISYKNVRARTLARIHSGRLDTSLGNGLLNFLVTRFMLHESRCKHHASIFEGDDGLASFSGQVNTGIAALLGMVVKAEIFDDVGEASFCGLKFAQSKQIIRDPVQTIIKMSWTGKQYARSGKEKLEQLQLAKAMSSLAETPACPIVNVFAQTIIEKLLPNHRLRSIMDLVENKVKADSYTLDRLKRGIARFESGVRFEQPTLATRLAVERAYGIGVDLQVLWEDIIRKSPIGGIRLPLIADKVKPACSEYWSEYVFTDPKMMTQRDRKSVV